MERIFDVRCRQYRFEKQCIGSYIAYYLRRNACYLPVAVDGGSTNLFVLRRIFQDAENGRLTVSQVLTNNLEGIYLARYLPEGIPLILYCTGGVLRESRAVFAGGADKAIREHNFTIAVVGINGFRPPLLSTTTQMEHPVKRAMINRASDSVILPIDSSKWGQAQATHLYTLDEIVSLGKTIVLVTCYPVREENESEDKFIERVKRFLQAAGELVQHWQYKVKIFVAPVSEREIEFQEAELSSKAMQAGVLREAYTQAIAPGQESQTGLVIGFDLRR
jgi:hypothetical protein